MSQAGYMYDKHAPRATGITIAAAVMNMCYVLRT